MKSTRFAGAVLSFVKVKDTVWRGQIANANGAVDTNYQYSPIHDNPYCEIRQIGNVYRVTFKGGARSQGRTKEYLSLDHAVLAAQAWAARRFRVPVAA